MRWPLRRIALRIFFAVGIAVALGIAAGKPAIALFVPFAKAELEWISGPFSIKSLVAEQVGHDESLTLRVGLARPVVVGGQLIPADPRSSASVSTLSGFVLQPVLVMLAVLIAWPAKNMRAWIYRFAFAVPLALFILAIDVPLVLLAEAYSTLMEATGDQSFSVLVAWKDFLQTGGRILLGLLAGLVTIMSTERIARTTKAFKKQGCPAHEAVAQN